MSRLESGLMILSGGLDSATALAVWLEECESLPRPERALNFGYGQSAQDQERAAAAAIANYYGVGRIHKIDLPMIRGSMLTNISYSNRLPLPGPNVPTYVPMRNLIFIAHAASLGYMLNTLTLGLGVHSADAPYPDCSSDFLHAIQSALDYGSDRSYKIYAPLLEMSKADIVRKGHELGVPFNLTWTCYVGAEVACGVCPACKIRLEAFSANNLEDPVEYLPEEDRPSSPYGSRNRQRREGHCS